MKKTAACLIGFSLIASQLSPALAEASESSVVENKSNEELEKYLNEDFDYKVVKNVSENVDQVEVKFGEEEAVALFDRENGTVTVDGELVATYKVISEETFDGSQIESSTEPSISTFSNFADYPIYTIGNTPNSGVMNIRKHSTTQISFVKNAQALSIAATLVGTFIDDKPSMKAAAIVAAAASTAALVAAEALTVNVTFKGKTDKYDSNVKEDSIYVYTGTSNGLFKINFKYWTNVW